MSAQALVTRRATLVQAVAAHKAAIRRHRAALRDAAAALAALEAECRRRGIALITTPSGEGSPHGRDDHSPA